MKPTALFIVTSDPRLSHRPAEAIRIAAGVGTWKKVGITLYLREAAVLALSEYADGLVDEDNFIRYLPILKDFGPVYVQRGEALLEELGAATLPYEEIDDAQLATLAAQHTDVLRF
ncbi:MAG: hypothetical protein WCO56_09370 [Verrucomicrobiota bacterium]